MLFNYWLNNGNSTEIAARANPYLHEDPNLPIAGTMIKDHKLYIVSFILILFQ